MKARTEVGQAVASIDFTGIKWKLGNSHGWDAERVDRAVEDYRKFLVLAATRPELSLVPGADLDEVWHTHILFTKQYHQDCEAVFGGYLHHAPWTGTEAAHCHGGSACRPSCRCRPRVGTGVEA